MIINDKDKENKMEILYLDLGNITNQIKRTYGKNYWLNFETLDRFDAVYVFTYYQRKAKPFYDKLIYAFNHYVETKVSFFPQHERSKRNAEMSMFIMSRLTDKDKSYFTNQKIYVGSNDICLAPFFKVLPLNLFSVNWRSEIPFKDVIKVDESFIFDDQEL